MYGSTRASNLNLSAYKLCRIKSQHTKRKTSAFSTRYPNLLETAFGGLSFTVTFYSVQVKFTLTFNNWSNKYYRGTYFVASQGKNNNNFLKEVGGTITKI